MTSLARSLLPAGIMLLLWTTLLASTAAANGVGTVYVASEGASSITVIDSNTNAPVEVIPLKLPPRSLVFSPDARWVYVSHRDSNVISFLDTSIEDITSSIRLGGQVGQLAITSGGTWLLAPDPLQGVLRVVDTASRAELFSVPVGGEPENVAAAPDGTTAFVADGASGTITMVDLKNRAVIRTINTQPGRRFPSLSPAPTSAELLVAGDAGDQLQVVDAETGRLKRTLQVSPASAAAVFSPTGELAYLPRLGRAEVTIVSTASGNSVGSISLPGEPAGIGISRDGAKAFVAIPSKDQVAVLDLTQKKVSALVSVDSGPTRVAVSPLQSRPQPIVMPGALPNTGGGPADQPSSLLIGAVLAAVGLAVIIGARRLSWRRG